MMDTLKMDIDALLGERWFPKETSFEEDIEAGNVFSVEDNMTGGRLNKLEDCTAQCGLSAA